MTTYETSGQESSGTDDVEPRTRRAVTEYISILEDGPGVDGADGLYLAVSHSGESYVLDHRTGACECPDAEYNLSPGEKCKHQRRLEVILGDREIPDAIDADDVDPQLGEHIDVNETPAATDATGDETAVATDGGIVVADDDGEILDETDGDRDDARPDDCDCGDFHTDAELPCWPCYREGFETPATEGDGE